MFSWVKKFPVVLFALLLSYLTAYAQSVPIRLGQSLPLTGPLAEIGTEYRDGMLAYFNALKDRKSVV
jgi:ABC-type branched-subunit amino acid transport system substrate-binding protein